MSGQRPQTSLLVMLSALTILLWVGFVGLIGASQVAADAVSSNTQTIEIAPSDDTFVSSWFPDIAMGGESTFWVVYDASYALLQFPLDQLPPNAQIISATLSLSIHPNSHLGGKTGQISMLEDANWDENSVTWYTKPDVDPDAPQVDISFEHYAQGASDEWDVTPLVQYALGQQSKALSSRQTVTATLPIQIRAKQPGEDSQEWYSKESGTTYEPKLIIRYQTATPTPTPTPTPAIPVLTMSGGGNESRGCPPAKSGDDDEEQELSVQSVTIAVNEVSDWKVTRISFDASGTGDEARHVKEARLYWWSDLVGRATYDRDNGTVSFDVDITIPAGSSVNLELRYVLDPDKMEWDNEANKLAKTYRTTTGIDNLSALPLNGATQYKMLPPEPIVGPMHYIARVWNITSFPRQGFGTIQAAVDAIVTQDGHTLDVCFGEYVENVRVTKELIIKGNATVRAAKPDQPTFTLTRSNTTIRNLVITGATGNGAAGILAAGESALRPLTNITIQYTQIHSNFYGIFFRHVDDSQVLQNRIVQNASYGIYVGPNRTADGAWVTIKDNTISENGAGVVVDDAWETQVIHNLVRSNGTSALARSAAALPDATGVGIYLRNTSNVLVQRNELSGQTGHAIVIEKTEAQTAENNRVEDNQAEVSGGYGVVVRGASKTLLINNRIANNRGGGVLADAAQELSIRKEGDGECFVHTAQSVGDPVAVLDIRNGSRTVRVSGCNVQLRDQDTGMYVENSQEVSLRALSITGGRYGIHLKNASNFLLWDGVQVTGQADTGLYCEDASDIQVRDGKNVFTGQGRHAMAFYRCTAPPRGQNAIRNVQFDGGSQAQHAVYLEGSKDFFFGDDTFTGYVGAGVAITATQNVQVFNSTFSNSAMAVDAANAQNVTVESNTIRGMTQAGVRAQNVTTLTLRENTVAPASVRGRSAAAPLQGGRGPDGFHLTDIQGGQVITNTVQNLGGQGVVVEGGQNVTLSGNTLQNLGGRGIYLRRGQGHAARSNTISNVQGGVLVWESNARVEKNTITDAKGYGIFLYNAEGATAAQNSVRNTARGTPDPDTPGADRNGDGHAFYQYRGRQNRVESNQFWGSDGNGVLLNCRGQTVNLVGCTQTTLVKNDIVDNNGYGMYIFYGDENQLLGNRVVNNRGVGIYLHGALACIVDDAGDGTHTTVEGHTHGVVIEGGRGNMVGRAQITRPAEHGIYLVDTELNSLEHNTITEPGKDGIRLVRSPRNIHWTRQGSIGNNTITKPGQYGIYATNSPENHFEVNKIDSPGVDGIFLHRSDKTLVEVNTIRSSGRYGIHLSATQEATLSKNSVEESGDHAIMLESSSNKNLIQENRLGAPLLEVGNQGDGIHLSYAHFNQVLANTVFQSQGYGAFMSVAEGNVFKGNTFQENGGGGLYAQGSRKLVIESNTFEDNKGNAIALVNSRVNTRAKRSMVRRNRVLFNRDIFDGGKNGIFLDNVDYIDLWQNRITGFPESGIYVKGVDHTTIKWNTLLDNCSGITIEDSRFGVDSVAYNTVRNSWCLFTGIHVTNSTAGLTGNEVSGSAGDGVIADQGATLTLRRNAIVDNGRDGLRALNGSQATLRENTLAGNEGLAVNNLDPDVTVDAQGNWWGDASGPGGEGPGTGDEVSAGVDYAGWLQGPAGLSATTTPSEAPALPDSQVTAWIGLHTLEALPITVTVTAGDDQGWLPVGYQETVVITQTGGVVLPITVTVPADAAPGAVDVVEVSAEAGAVEARATFTVTVIAPLQSVSITGPTTAFQGETATYTATIAPAEASDISILWSPEPSSGQGATTATMVWNTFGLYPVTVEVEQLGRVVQAEKLVAVWGDNRIYMPIVK